MAEMCPPIILNGFEVIECGTKNTIATELVTAATMMIEPLVSGSWAVSIPTSASPARKS
jgi:hypothetical protein